MTVFGGRDMDAPEPRRAALLRDLAAWAVLLSLTAAAAALIAEAAAWLLLDEAMLIAWGVT